MGTGAAHGGTVADVLRRSAGAPSAAGGRKKKWGKNFTLKLYHDTVLSFGSPPVRYVRELALDLPID